jgi:hypothetical protein
MKRIGSCVAAVALLAHQGSTLTSAQDGSYEVATFCTPYPSNTRPPVTVRNGSELQNALDDAQAGDTILLAPGATYHPVESEGSFVLRNRSIPSGQWVVIRSASRAFNAGGDVPPGRRVEPSDAGAMARLRGTRPMAPVVRAAAGARGYRLVGLDIGVEAGVRQMTALVELGGNEDAPAMQPSDIVIDRCVLHGNDEGNFRRGIAMNGSRLAVIESRLENFHDDSSDSQAVAGWNGPGPFKIVNNFLEAASETVMFGGADPRIPGLVPSDIEVRRNLMTRRLAWKTARVPVKNAFELKNARRVLVEGNVFENVWASGQDGTAIVFKSTNQDGRCAHCVTEYVVFRHNIVRNAANGVVINAAEAGKGAPMPVPANHIVIENVLFLDIGGAEWGGGAKLFRVFGGVADLTISHVTSTANARGILDSEIRDRHPRLVFSYNIVERKYYGIGAGREEGVGVLSRSFPEATYKQNLIVNTSQDTDQATSTQTLKERYPALTWVVNGWSEVRFQPGTYKLAASSPYRSAGDDGKDIGVDFTALGRAQFGPGGSAACPAKPD